MDEIRGIPPAIAIEQANPVKSSRSTVGTMTEINDYLKFLWPRIAHAFCPSCGREIRPETAKSIADQTFCASLLGRTRSHHLLGSSPGQNGSARFLQFSPAARLSARVDGQRNRARGCRAKNQEARRARTGHSGPDHDQRRKPRASGRSHRNRASFRKRADQCRADFCGGRIACELKERGHTATITSSHSPPAGIAPIAISTSVRPLPGYSALTIHSVPVPNAADLDARLRSI